MDLEEELAAIRAEFARKAPEGRVALYQAKIDALRARFAFDAVPAPGDEAPDFTLPDAKGGSVSLHAALRDGPAIVTFYRGGWCPYCNVELRAYQRLLPEIADLGARLMAVSPQMPDGSLSTAETNGLEFDVLSDVGNGAARAFGLAYALPEELREVMRANGKPLPGFNGDESWELPLPGTFVIGGDGRIALAFVDADYRARLDPADALAALRSLKAAAA